LTARLLDRRREKPGTGSRPTSVHTATEHRSAVSRPTALPSAAGEGATPAARGPSVSASRAVLGYLRSRPTPSVTFGFGGLLSVSCSCCWPTIARSAGAFATSAMFGWRSRQPDCPWTFFAHELRQFLELVSASARFLRSAFMRHSLVKAVAAAGLIGS